MVDQTLLAWAPITVLLPALAFIADFYLTLRGAKAYQRIRQRYPVEGSYELNETWIETVDRGRISWRVVSVALFWLGYMLVVWLFAHAIELNPRLPGWWAAAFFGAGAGLLLLVQVPILMVHATNLAQFRAMVDPTAAKGNIVLSRWLALRQIEIRSVIWALVWALLAAISLQAFFLAGATSSVAMAVRYRGRSRAARALAANSNASTTTG